MAGTNAYSGTILPRQRRHSFVKAGTRNTIGGEIGLASVYSSVREYRFLCGGCSCLLGSAQDK